MFAKCCGATTLRVDGQIIDVEVDVANGLPGVEMIGMPDTMVREAKERVRTAVKNSGIKVMSQKVTINLAPAGIRKDSPGLDLPIAMAMMAAYGIISQESIEGNLFSGELSLEGQVRGVAGILPMDIKTKEMGFKGLAPAIGGWDGKHCQSKRILDFSFPYNFVLFHEPEYEKNDKI